MYEWFIWLLLRFILPVTGWIVVNILMIIVFEWSSKDKKSVGPKGNSLF